MKSKSFLRFHVSLLLLFFALLVCLAPVAAQRKPSAQPTPKPPERSIALSQPSTVKVLPGRAKRFALVVGVDKYADTQITTLGGASNDARALANALVTYAGFPADQVILLASDQPPERQPTRGNILRRLSNLAAVVPPDGLLLFSFASHGMERGGQAFLLPSDAQVSNDVTLLEQSAINVTQIKDWVRKIGVKQVLLILDACRNDPAGRSDVDNPLTPTYTRGFNFDVRNHEVEAFATIYATAVGHRAFEYKEKHQGYFTWALVEGLRGGAANESGEVTLASLIKYLQDRVPKQVLIDLGPGKDQRPFAVVEGYKSDGLVLSYINARGSNSVPADAPVFLPNETTAADNTERSARADSSGTTLEGTTWTGTTITGRFTIEFIKGGRLTHITNGVRNGKEMPFVTEGTWTQAGKVVQITVGSYSIWQGTIEGDVMQGEASNSDGEKWKWMLFKKPQ